MVFVLTKISTYISGCCVFREIIHFENIACPKKVILAQLTTGMG
jgi:hypothetical protein